MVSHNQGQLHHHLLFLSHAWETERFHFFPPAYLIGGLAGLWTKKMERNKVPGKLAHNLLEQHISRAQTASVTTQVLLVPRQSRPSLLLSANPLAWLCSLMPS